MYSKEGKGRQIKASFSGSNFKDQNKSRTNPITKVMCAAHRVLARDLNAVRVTGTALTRTHTDTHTHTGRHGDTGKGRGGKNKGEERERKGGKIMKES